MKRLLIPLFLAGCGVPLPEQTSGPLFEVYRDAHVQIASKALFEQDKYMGTWYEVGRFPVSYEQGCADVTVQYALNVDGQIAVQNTCRDVAGTVASTINGTAEIVGPGRLAVTFPTLPFGTFDHWVLWTDAGYRTAVIGSPDGRSGWILNRDRHIPADRLKAAREVLDFNGYDVTRLVMMPQGGVQ